MKSMNAPEPVKPDLVAYSRVKIWMIVILIVFTAILFGLSYNMHDPSWRPKATGGLAAIAILILRDMPPILRSVLALAMAAFIGAVAVELIWLRFKPRIILIIDENGIEQRAPLGFGGSRRVAWGDIGEIEQRWKATRLIRSSAANREAPRKLIIDHKLLSIPTDKIHAVIRQYRPDLFMEKQRRPWWKF